MKKKIYSIFTALTVIFMLVGCTSTQTIMNESVPIPDFEHDTPVGEINMNSLVEQTFVCKCNSIDRIELYGATYMRTNSGTVVITLYTSDDADIYDIPSDKRTVISKWELDAAGFEDNAIISLEIDANSTANTHLTGKSCLIEITSPNSNAGEAVTFWSTQEDECESGNLYISGFGQYNDLWFKVYGR